MVCCIKNHFSRIVGRERPVFLLVDGHTSHINLDISKFCKEDGILLYCLPPRSFHVTQPLGMSFSPLKANWKAAVTSLRVSHVGQSLTKDACFCKGF